VILARLLAAASPLLYACSSCAFYESFGSIYTPRTRISFGCGFTLVSPIRTVAARSLRGYLFFLVKWISWYFSGANLAPCLLAHLVHFWWITSSRRQFCVALSPYTTRLVSSTNPSPIELVSPWVSCSSSEIKKRKSISETGDPCGIPVSVVIHSPRCPGYIIRVRLACIKLAI
jgi:hypothetical protein